MTQGTIRRDKAESPPNIEVGTGIAYGDNPYAAGREAAFQAAAGIVSHPLSAVVVFASAFYRLDEMLAGIRDVVGNVPVFGASSAGEICNGVYSRSVAVMALASPFLSVSAGLGTRVSADWRRALHEATGFEGMSRYFTPQDSNHYNAITREGRSTFAMLFSPASTAASDSYSPEILEELKRLSHGRIPFFGGSAINLSGTCGHQNFVFYGGSAHCDSMVLVVFETSLKFGITMGHGFHPTAKKAIATKVRNREVLELDGKPAADVFAEFHDLPGKTLEENPLFKQKTVRPFGMRHSLGQYTIFVPQSVTPDGGIVLSHPAEEGTPLVLMESIEDEVAAAGKDTLQRAMMQSGIAEPAAILICSCFRRLNLLNGRRNDEISLITGIMPGIPLAGFYCAGEQGTCNDHVSRHNNETIVILLLGNELSYAAKVAEENRNLHRMLEVRLAEQKRLESELENQVYFLQTLIDTIPTPIFYKDRERRYLGCNRAFEAYMDVRREEILGKEVKDIETADKIEVHDKVDVHLLQKGSSAVYESMNRPKDGNAHHDIIHKAAFYGADGSIGGLVAIVTDITDLKHAEDALRASEEKFLRAFHNNPTMMVISSVDEGRIIEVNESYLRTMGYTRQEIVGRASQDPRRPLDPGQCDPVLSTIEGKGSLRNLEVPLMTKDGAERHCLLSTERILLQNVEHTLVLLQDITDRKRAEEERLQRMQLQSVLDMSGTICHEFNQPIQVLSGYTELLMSLPDLDPDIQQKLQMIKEQTDRMERITRKLLTIKNCSVKDYAGIGKIMDLHEDLWK